MDVALQDRDVWMVGRVQSEALREGLAQASIGGRRGVDYCWGRVQRDVDGRDGVLLCARRLCIAELRSQDAECDQDLHVSKNGSRDDVLLRLGPARHTFGDVTVQRFSFASDGGILHGQRSDWRWSFPDSRHRRLWVAWVFFSLRPAKRGESCYLL